MKYFLLVALVLQSAFVFAQSQDAEIAYELSSKEGRENLKQGFVFGLGMNQTVYTLFQDFQGTADNFSQEKVNLNGPQLNWGHDWLWGGWFVTGFRLEGFYSTTFGRNSKEKQFSKSKIDGNVQGGQVVGRIGSVFGIKTKNPFMGEYGRLLGEFFIEGGLGRGSSNLEKSYSYKENTTEERYDIKVKEDFNSQIISTGLTFTSAKGATLELKFTQVGIISNQVQITGAKFIGGVNEPISEKLDNPKSSPIYLGSVMIGYHW